MISSDFQLGPWTVQPALHRLCNGDTECQVSHKVMAVLLLLADEPGRVVRKDELIRRVWDGAFTSDEALTTVIYELRKALGDDARRPRFVETIRKGGYRLIGEVVPLGTDSETAPDQTAPDRTEPDVATENLAPPASTLPTPDRGAPVLTHRANTPAERHPAQATDRVGPPPPTASRMFRPWWIGIVAALLALAWLGRPSAREALGPAAPPIDAEPVEAAADTSGGSTLDPIPNLPSLAVLPLASFGEQCRQDSFAGGLTEMLISDLAASVPLEVLPSLSTRTVDDRWSLDDVASKLDADLVVEGTLVRAGERMWLSIQLVEIATGRMLWGGSYERRLDDSLEQQRALALEIAEEVGRHAAPTALDRPALALPPAAAP